MEDQKNHFENTEEIVEKHDVAEGAPTPEPEGKAEETMPEPVPVQEEKQSGTSDGGWFLFLRRACKGRSAVSDPECGISGGDGYDASYNGRLAFDASGRLHPVLRGNYPVLLLGVCKTWKSPQEKFLQGCVDCGGGADRTADCLPDPDCGHWKRILQQHAGRVLLLRILKENGAPLSAPFSASGPEARCRQGTDGIEHMVAAGERMC